jgi:hypothetical protein
LELLARDDERLINAANLAVSAKARVGVPVLEVVVAPLLRAARAEVLDG